MRNRLPVHIENRELPIDESIKNMNNNSYGYVNILFLSSVIVTIVSITMIIVLGNR